VKPRHLYELYVIVPVLAVLTTWATGFWGNPGSGPEEYGFPLPWKTVGLVPTCFMCPLPMSYNWGFLVLDVAFYAAIGYGVVLFHELLVRKQPD